MLNDTYHKSPEGLLYFGKYNGHSHILGLGVISELHVHTKDRHCELMSKSSFWKNGNCNLFLTNLSIQLEKNLLPGHWKLWLSFRNSRMNLPWGRKHRLQTGKVPHKKRHFLGGSWMLIGCIFSSYLLSEVIQPFIDHFSFSKRQPWSY